MKCQSVTIILQALKFKEIILLANSMRSHPKCLLSGWRIAIFLIKYLFLAQNSAPLSTRQIIPFDWQLFVIFQGADGAHLAWDPPANSNGNISEYSVYLAIKNSQSTDSPSSLAFVLVYRGKK